MNTYLIVSETIYHAEEALKKLKGNITNIVSFNMEENTLEDILEEASYYSLFNEEKCIVVRNANIFAPSKSGDSKKKDDSAQKLTKYWENENKNTKIIFIYEGKVDTRKKIYTILKDANNVLEFPKLTKTEMKNELQKIVTKSSYKITDDSLWLIINNTLGNFDLAYNELKKIMLYYNEPTMIKSQDVKELCSNVLEDNNFKLVDSIIARDYQASLGRLREFKTLKGESSIIISLLYREFKLMLSALIYEEKHYAKKDILANLNLAEWQYNKVKNNLLSYNKREIKEEIVKLSNLDYELKSGLIDKDVILLKYILSICL